MRKKFITKILLFIFVFISISLFISSPLALPAPQYARAAEKKQSWVGSKLQETVYPRLSVPVGEFGRDCAGCYTSSDPEACFKQCKSPFKDQPKENWLGLYIIAWFHYLVGAIGIIAVVMIMWGGILWITAGGNASQIDNAKGKIKNAVIGIVLLLCTYTIFKTINPRMLSLQLPPIEPVKESEKVCCELEDGSKTLKYVEECPEKDQLDDISLCSNKSNICKKNRTIPCGTYSANANCMGIKPSQVGNICLVFTQNNITKSAFELTPYKGGNPTYIKVMGHQGEKFIFYESASNPGQFYECGDVNDDKGYIGTYCPFSSNTNCWAQIEKEGAVYEITAPSCE